MGDCGGVLSRVLQSAFDERSDTVEALEVVRSVKLLVLLVGFYEGSSLPIGRTPRVALGEAVELRTMRPLPLRPFGLSSQVPNSLVRTTRPCVDCIGHPWLATINLVHDRVEPVGMRRQAGQRQRGGRFACDHLSGHLGPDGQINLQRALGASSSTSSP